MRSTRFLAIAFVVAACYPKSAPPPETITSADVAAAQAKWPDATEASLVQGKDLFLGHCNECHGYPVMDAESPNSWPDTLTTMAKKAHLNAAERELVLRYIITEDQHITPTH